MVDAIPYLDRTGCQWTALPADFPHPKLEHRLVRRVEVSARRPVGVDADGERPGGLPAVFEVLPGALEVLAP